MAQGSGEQDGFLDGLVTGAVIGAVVGGVLTGLLMPRLRRDRTAEPESVPQQPVAPSSLEDARRVLDEKIAELNQAIEQTRDRLTSTSAQPDEPPDPAAPAASP
ncbi:hypothetical protein [Gloeobacter kilaueensis]|uniref:Gas vesicle protein n=1 Tax=Gloeobacter kilaueensis (strain ATCC BAA-2537 / CCAP 1431/1 / ULC 316 / JS1) TaxID=1183438 RepID=U5QI76_GLOK1|nr:hypothetical protein [Gloeobacter kilaueensis]AGY57340.1 hypothetical protein GKIL_1094 [Gloeobacter kilaueensis JS1]